MDVCPRLKCSIATEVSKHVDRVSQNRRDPRLWQVQETHEREPALQGREIHQRDEDRSFVRESNKNSLLSRSVSDVSGELKSSIKIQYQCSSDLVCVAVTGRSHGFLPAFAAVWTRKRRASQQKRRANVFMHELGPFKRSYAQVPLGISVGTPLHTS